MNYIFRLILLLLTISCDKTGSQANVAVGELFDKKLDVAESVLDDSVKNILKSTNYKIITYVDGRCSACVSDFRFWAKIQNDSLLKSNNVEVIYYVYTYDYKQLKSRQRAFKISNVVYDEQNSFYKLNELEKYNDTYHTFLVDGDNKIKIVGSPIKKTKIFELYKKIISENK